MTTPATAAVLTEVIDGVQYDSAHYAFQNGKLVLNKDGTPKKRPGRKPKNPAASPPSLTVVPDAAPPSPPAAQQTPSEPPPPPAPAPAPAVAEAVVKAVPPASVNVVAPPAVTVVNQTPVQTPGAKPAAQQPAVPALPLTVVAPPATQPAKVFSQKHDATITVSKSYGKIGATENKQETIEVKTFAAPPAIIEMGYGLTLNIGNYESARVDVKLNIPCYREEVDDAYEWARKWAEERIKREVKEVRAIAAPTKDNPF